MVDISLQCTRFGFGDSLRLSPWKVHNNVQNSFQRNPVRTLGYITAHALKSKVTKITYASAISLDELVTEDDPRESFEDHFHRQLTHRYAGTLAGRTTVKPENIVRQIALFVGTYYIASFIRSKELLLSPENNLKCANTMLKIEIRSLGKDLERRDDLCDDLLNEIYRHERKIDIKAAENDELILKNKSRLAKIKILREELKRLGTPAKLGGVKSGGNVDPPPAKAPSSKSKEKSKKKVEKEKQPASESSTTSDEEKWLYDGDVSSGQSAINSPNFDSDYKLFDETGRKRLTAAGSYDSGFEQIDC